MFQSSPGMPFNFGGRSRNLGDPTWGWFPQTLNSKNRLKSTTCSHLDNHCLFHRYEEVLDLRLFWRSGPWYVFFFFFTNDNCLHRQSVAAQRDWASHYNTPGMHFWTIFTPKPAIAQDKVTESGKHFNLSWRFLKSFLKYQPSATFLHSVTFTQITQWKMNTAEPFLNCPWRSTISFCKISPQSNVSPCYLLQKIFF